MIFNKFNTIEEETDDSDIYQDGDIVAFRFNGNTYHIPVKYVDSDMGDARDIITRTKVQALSTYFDSDKFWKFIFAKHKMFIRSRYDGKCNNGRDLKELITDINFIVFSAEKRSLFVCGDYEVDLEHPFAISFPEGRYIEKTGEDGTTLMPFSLE